MTKEKKKNNGIPDILVMGIGNFLMGDEGVGVHFIINYEKELASQEIEALDGGTGGFHLMSHFEGHEKVILIDASMDGKSPGTITLLKPKFSSDFPSALSAHDIGLKDLIEALILREKLPEIYLYTISISEIQNMVTELSPEIANSLPALLKQVQKLIIEIQNSGKYSE